MSEPVKIAEDLQELFEASKLDTTIFVGSQIRYLIERVSAAEAALALAKETWRCFHCGFETSDRDEAEAHFGDHDDAEPMCKHWSRLDKEEQLGQFQSLLQELNAERRTNDSLRISNEGLEYQVNANAGAISAYKPFRECRSINDVFFVYDSMEGRALAAEESVAARSKAPDGAQEAEGK